MSVVCGSVVVVVSVLKVAVVVVVREWTVL